MQCSVSELFAERHPPQIYKAQYGDAMFVSPLSGTKMAAAFHRRHLELNYAMLAATLRW